MKLEYLTFPSGANFWDGTRVEAASRGNYREPAPKAHARRKDTRVGLGSNAADQFGLRAARCPLLAR